MNCSSINNNLNANYSHFPTVFNDFKQDYANFNSAPCDSADFSNKEADDESCLYFDKIKSKQGIIGKSWDYIKNKFNLKNSSNSINAMMEQYKNKEISKEELEQSINNYTKGQTKALDFVADWGTMLAGATAFSISLSLFGGGVPIGLCAAAMSGVLTKVGIKFLDAKTGDRKYNTAFYDAITGSINGLLSPVVDGIGNSATKFAAKKLGIKAVSNSAKTQLAKKFATNNFEKIVLCGKQKLIGNKIQKGIATLIGKTIKSPSKFVLALILRESAFKYCEFSSKKNLIYNNFLPNISKFLNIEDKKKESLSMKIGTMDTSNDVYKIENRTNQTSF